MKTKTLFLATLVSAAAVSANAGISFGISFGPPVVYQKPIVVVTPAPPAPIVEVAPACPGVEYVWAPGYWLYQSDHYVWIPGGWNYHHSHVRYGHYHGGYRR